MQLNNLIIMPNRAPNPESVPALRKEIHQLAASLGELKQSLNVPSRWRKLVLEHPVWSKVISALLVALIIGLISIVKGSVGSLSDLYIDGRAKAIADPMEKQIADIDERTSRIEGELGAIQLRRLSSTPGDPQSIIGVKTVLDTARNSEIKLPLDVVQESGMAFINAASKEPSAWETALAFLDYRSSINVYSRRVNTIKVPPEATTYYDLNPPVDGKPVPQLSHTGTLPVAPGDAAHFETIGHNLNQNLQYGTAELRLTGGAVSLDDKYIRHVLFQGVEIHYTGKPLMLEDVLFINCTFVFSNTPKGRQLGHELLASSPITFETAG